MVCRIARRRTLQQIAGWLLLPAAAGALEGPAALATRKFGLVGTLADAQDAQQRGFPATQIAPSWIITAAHVPLDLGRRFAHDFGWALAAAVSRLSTTAPTQAPFDGAVRDDLALIRLATPILTPYLPRLMDDGILQRQPAGGDLTMVSNNPGLRDRRSGFAGLRAFTRRQGYDFLIVGPRGLQLASGDSGSPLFLGHLTDTDADSVLVGVASARSTDQAGRDIAVYSRLGPHRAALDALVGESGERLRWSA